jgi:DNA mismatch repair protein MLH1
LLPGGVWSKQDSSQAGAAAPSKAGAGGGNGRKTPARPERNDSSLVRTDANLRKITSMLPPAASGKGTASPTGSRAAAGHGVEAQEAIEYETVDREMTTCRLTSIRELRSAVREDMHQDLTEIFGTHTFVGIVDDCRRLAAIQAGVKLYLVDYGRVCFEYFYQLGLTDFGNFGFIRFSPPLDLRELIAIGAELELKDDGSTPLGDDDDVSVSDVVKLVAEQLIERREMLLEYFSMEISPTGELLSIPLLIKGYTPAILKLPKFLVRLGPNVDWESEKGCFETFIKELATFYVPEPLSPAPSECGDVEDQSNPGGNSRDKTDPETRARQDHVHRAVEHVLFPAFKARLVATKSLAQGAVLEVANLKGLYRVFERC